MCKELLLDLEYRYTFDPQAGCFYHKLASGKVRKGDRAGYVHSDGYRYVRAIGRVRPEHHMVWLLTRGELPPGNRKIDHKDRVKSNNAPTNLRLATGSQNNVNAGKRCDNKTGYRGVYFSKAEGKYRGVVYKNYKAHSCGQFASAEEAAIAVELKRKEFYGEFA